MPEYHDERLPTGRPITDFAITHTDRVRISPIQGCSFVCTFCDLPYDKRYEKMPIEGLIDSIRRALEDQVLKAHHVLISGGVLTTGTGADRLTEMVAANPEHYKWFFRVMHKSSELGEVTTDFAIHCLAEKFGIKKFAILVEDDIWTKYIRDIWTKRLSENPGTQVVFSGTFSEQTKDFSVARH